ncbi:hypothetical protein PoB_007178200 [Plakobranchus ocellatus]|uniref:Uncharacterized protein n=1 Tax=Plakobranchus ocellatus TaxID=259542 RepID=A0AAV4DMD6_9GAST|nr:hypothetical protein PoB_007178200 [Plakobranchus ocellatus]
MLNYGREREIEQTLHKLCDRCHDQEARLYVTFRRSESVDKAIAFVEKFLFTNAGMYEPTKSHRTSDLLALHISSHNGSEYQPRFLRSPGGGVNPRMGIVTIGSIPLMALGAYQGQLMISSFNKLRESIKSIRHDGAVALPGVDHTQETMNKISKFTSKIEDQVSTF